MLSTQSDEKLSTQFSAKLSTQLGEQGAADSLLLSSQPDGKLSTQFGEKLSTQRGKKLSTQHSAKVTDIKEFAEKLSTQSDEYFDNKKWKRSTKRPGYLIRRIKPGYQITENEYGVMYLYVLGRNRTSGDAFSYPLAGYFNWAALEASGQLKKERIRAKRTG